MATVAAATGLSIIAMNGALTVPLLTTAGATATAAGAFATPLAVIGVLKLAAALAAAGGYAATNTRSSSGNSRGFRFGGVFRRHRRDAVADAAETEEVAAAEIPSQEALFSLISAMDTQGCGKQLICELEAKNPASLASDEVILLKLFSNKQPLKTINAASAKADYEVAAELGKMTQDQKICRYRYSTCTFTGDEMMTALRNSQL